MILETVTVVVLVISIGMAVFTTQITTTAVATHGMKIVEMYQEYMTLIMIVPAHTETTLQTTVETPMTAKT
jgi:hypothetical protein